MTFSATIFTSAAGGVLLPFNTLAAEVAAQASLDAVANPLAQGGILQFTTITATSGVPSLPAVAAFGGVVNRATTNENLGVIDPAYRILVNQSPAQMIAVGSTSDTTVVSGMAGSVLFANQAPASTVLLGGGNNVLSNVNAQSGMTVIADGPGGTALARGTLLLDDSAGGTMTVSAVGGLLVDLLAGGGEQIVGQTGTVVILSANPTGGQTGTATISASGASTTLWVGALGARTMVTPGAGNLFVFNGVSGGEGAVTVFGGKQVIGGQTLTAPAMTGQTTALGAVGYIAAGSAGGSILYSGTAVAATTLLAGGVGDILFLNGVGDTAVLGDQQNVIMTAGRVNFGGGVNVSLGGGSGQVFGAVDGYNSFVFSGAGAYTVSGFHDTSVFGLLPGSTYRDAATAPGGAGNITITDFLPQQFTGGPVFDSFDMGSATLASLGTTDLGGGLFTDVATLSDGTMITFANTFGTVHQSGSLLV